MVPNDEPKSVNIDKISTALHVYYLNLIVNYLNTVQIAQIQAYNFECTPCSDAISGPMNRMFDIKSGHDFCRYRNSIQVIYFQINDQKLCSNNFSWCFHQAKLVLYSLCKRTKNLIHLPTLQKSLLSSNNFFPLIFSFSGYEWN